MDRPRTALKKSAQRRSRRPAPLAENRASGAIATWPSAQWKQQFRRRLLAWFQAHQRDLPWRKTRDPYRVWISEIMLQQTQVATVIPYFERFLAAFPDVATLARADEHDVLRLWEGLGYYRRARQLHRAAQVIASEHGGEFPRDLEAVRALPGIGRYTTGAIASIAYDTSAPILEANTVRLYCRLLAYREAPATAASQKLLWEFAESLLPAKGAGQLNQALMELGSLICSPRAPDCAACPVRDLCPTRRLGLQASIPQSKPPKNFERLREASVVVWQRGKVLVRQRTATERWAGMWDFVRFPLQNEREEDIAAELIANVRTIVGVQVAPGERLTTLHHGVTRFRIELACYHAAYHSGRVNRANSQNVKWVFPKELEGLALSVTARKIARLVMKQAGTSTVKT